MNKRTHSTDMIQSPWLDQTKPNLFRDEFQLARENLPGEYFTPIEPYRWIFRNNGENLFFNRLLKYSRCQRGPVAPRRNLPIFFSHFEISAP